MFDSAFDRTLSYRLSAAYDCWGNRRSLRRGTRNGIWFIDASAIDQPATEAQPVDPDPARERGLRELQSSGRFTTLELATLHSLIIERATIAEIAERHGCSRQAVIARLVGNSRGQGGILKKAQALLRR
ncbi:MAG: hypothetical protein WC815_16115 [Vicinamibacterales bacterium]|jgi:hypothetical protein